MQTSNDKTTRDWHSVMLPIVREKMRIIVKRVKEREVSYVGFSRVLGMGEVMHE